MDKYYLRSEISEEVNNELAKFSPFVRELLFYRDVKDAESAEKFLNPSYDNHLHSPFLLRDMKKATERILSAIREGERIVIYSDYDSDGIAAGAIFSDFFTKIGYTNFRNYIPHRHNEGYGLNKEAIEGIIKEGTSLLITADCGITDKEPIQLATDSGMDVIVTDHHLSAEESISAASVIDPHCKGESYPDSNLCGAGVVFKVVSALLELGDFEVKDGWEKWLLDLVGLATIADMVPLYGENRLLAKYGLLVLSKSRRPGIVELCRKMNVDQKQITEDDVGFMLAPRINATSRMDSPDKALKLLSTSDSAEAASLADEINRINDKRKGVVASMIKEIRGKIEDKTSKNEVIVTGNPNWKPALLGLAANSLVKEYGGVVFLWGREGNGHLKGSCRSDGSVDLSALMEEASDVFLSYGGHKWAGGFSVSYDMVHSLEERLSESYRKTAGEADTRIPIDRTLTLGELSWENHRQINQLTPFGEGNPKPLFLFKNVFVEKIQKFGKNNTHLKLILKNDSGAEIPAISFFRSERDFERTPEEGERANIIASIEKSTYGGEHLRLRIVDVV